MTLHQPIQATLHDPCKVCRRVVDGLEVCERCWVEGGGVATPREHELEARVEELEAEVAARSAEAEALWRAVRALMDRGGR